MSELLTVADGRVVLFHYVLKDDAGVVIDASQEEPLAYLHGQGNIVPGLERQMTGLKVGDELVATVPPEEAYGAARGDVTESVHRSAFPKDMELQVGMPVRAEGPDGQPLMLWVEKIEGARVTITLNHPLAGKTLHFSVRIAEIREANENEIAHGHAHGPDGHHHH